MLPALYSARGPRARPPAASRPRPPAPPLPCLQFLEAAKAEGHAQAPALAALGRYFSKVEGREDQAARCYKRALAVDPGVDVAGAEGGSRRASSESAGTEE